MFKSGCSKNKDENGSNALFVHTHTHTHYLLKNKIKKAMTLAETLITLGIIAVVAAMTIPNLITNYQKDQTALQLKKAYGEVSQAVSLSTVDNGMVENWDWALADTDKKKFINTYLTPYFQISKNCGYVSSSSSCVNVKTYYLNGEERPVHSSDYYIFLTDGKRLAIWVASGSLQITVDLNGNKKPNRLGRDIFIMGRYYWYPNPNSIIFRAQGYKRATLLGKGDGHCNKESTNAGLFCGAIIQMDGWKIKDDYPWN